MDKHKLGSYPDLSNHPNRCAALDQNGKRCNIVETTPVRVGYHGDSESYYGEPTTWVLVVLCQWHRSDYQTEHADEYDVNGLRPGR